MADATRKRLVFVVDKQGKSVIDPPSRNVHSNAYDTLQSIFDDLKDVPSCELLHVVFKQNALSDPARDSQYVDLYDLIKDCEADMVQAWGEGASIGVLHFVVDRQEVQTRPPAAVSAFQTMMRKLMSQNRIQGPVQQAQARRLIQSLTQSLTQTAMRAWKAACRPLHSAASVQRLSSQKSGRQARDGKGQQQL